MKDFWKDREEEFGKLTRINDEVCMSATKSIRVAASEDILKEFEHLYSQYGIQYTTHFERDIHYIIARK